MPDIKKKLKEYGFTTQMIADKIGISQQAVSQAINGNPTLSRLQEIAGAMGITVSELVKDEEVNTQDRVVFTVGKDVKTIVIEHEQ